LLELRIDNIAVRDHQYGIENLGVVGVMQLSKEVRRPGDGVRLPGSGRMLNEILAARSILQDCLLELAGDIELVESREDDRGELVLLVTHPNEIATQDVQPALAKPDVLPQIRSRMSGRIGRIAGTTVVSLVEGQEVRGRAHELRRHVHFAIADSEMHQCPT